VAGVAEVQGKLGQVVDAILELVQRKVGTSRVMESLSRSLMKVLFRI